MTDAGKAPNVPVSDDAGTSQAERTSHTARTRRSRVYGLIKRVASEVRTAVAPLVAEPDQANDPPELPASNTVASPSPSSALITNLNAATQGLTFQSETDAPVEVFVWPSDRAFSPDALRSHADIDGGEPFKTEQVDHFFRNVTKPREWHEAAEQEQVRRFGALRDLLIAELSDATVYRFGTTAADVFVLGRASDGTTLGIRTKVVET